MLCGNSHKHDLELLRGNIKKIHGEGLTDQVIFYFCGYDLRGTVTMIDPNTKEQKQRPIQPKESVPLLVEAYNKSKDPDVIILSIIVITESFVILKKHPEACVSIQRIERTLEKIKKIDSDYELSPSDVSFIERIKE